MSKNINGKPSLSLTELIMSYSDQNYWPDFLYITQAFHTATVCAVYLHSINNEAEKEREKEYNKFHKLIAL